MNRRSLDWRPCRAVYPAGLYAVSGIVTIGMDIFDDGVNLDSIYELYGLAFVGGDRVGILGSGRGAKSTGSHEIMRCTDFGNWTILRGPDLSGSFYSG